MCDMFAQAQLDAEHDHNKLAFYSAILSVSHIISNSLSYSLAIGPVRN